MAALWLQIILAILSAGANNIGKALQQQSTQRLPPLTLSRKVLGQYLATTGWLGGISLDIGGGVLMVLVLALPGAQVSVIQPAAGLGLVVLAVYAHCFQEAIRAREWLGAALASSGIVALGYTAAHTHRHDVAYTCVQAAGLMLCGAGVGLVWTLRAGGGAGAPGRRGASKGARGSGADQQVAGVLVGLQAGACFGASAACTRLGFMMAAKHGAMAALGVAFSLQFSSTGIVLQTNAFKGCSAVVVCTACCVAAMLTGVVTGVGLLGEELPRGWRLRAVAAAGWTAILLGLGLLAGQSAPKSATGEGLARARESSYRADRSWSLGERLNDSAVWRAVVPAGIRKWLTRSRGTISLDLLPRHNSTRGGLRID